MGSSPIEVVDVCAADLVAQRAYKEALAGFSVVLAEQVLLRAPADDFALLLSGDLDSSVTDRQATTVRAAGGPIDHGADGTARASAGWLIEHLGHHRNTRVAPGIWCSTRRALTLVARTGAIWTSRNGRPTATSAMASAIWCA